MKFYELKPINTNQKSFYKKAFVQEDTAEYKTYINNEEVNNLIVAKNLFSYDSNVMRILKQYENGNISSIKIQFLNGSYYYSNTTNKHKKEFLEQEGIFDIIEYNEIRNKKEVNILFRENLLIETIDF